MLVHLAETGKLLPCLHDLCTPVQGLLRSLTKQLPGTDRERTKDPSVRLCQRRLGQPYLAAGKGEVRHQPT